MQKQPPTPARLLVLVVFGLSCFALLTYLWVSFGGAIPLAPQGYRFTASFNEATQLATQADVRISGVTVGHVKSVDTEADGRSRATIEIDDRYAPRPAGTRAILRQKTLLGETYVELTPGDRTHGTLRDGGALPAAQVSPTVELDEIFRAFDARTREAFRTWLQAQAGALRGRGLSLNDALGNLPGFASDSDALLRVLLAQQAGVRGVVRDTGTVFDALSARDGELRQLVDNSDRVFAATAQRDADLQGLFRALPEFQRQSTLTVDRLTRFARNTDPVVTRLRPAARELSPTLRELGAVALDLKALLREVPPLERASRAGLPATDRFLGEFAALLGEFDGPLRQLNPTLRFLGAYRDELRAFITNVAALTEATDRPLHAKGPVHYARAMTVLNPQTLSLYPHRIGSDRANAYQLPHGALAKHVYEPRRCGAGDPVLADPAAFPQLVQYTFGGRTSGPIAAPPCAPQGANGAGGALPGLFPRVVADP